MLENKKIMLSLKDLEEEYGLNPNTIKRERYEQKAVQEKRLKEDDVRNASGFGYTTEAYQMYGKLFYKREDVENFISKHRQQSPKEILHDG